MNIKVAKKIRKETRLEYRRELQNYRSLSLWRRIKLALRVLAAV